MRLLQLNTWGGRLMDNIIRLVRRLDPDIICLQEVISTDLPMVFGTLQDLLAALDHPEFHFSPTFHFTVMGADAEFGNAIISRHPISRRETTFINLEYSRDFSFHTHDYNIRNFQHASMATAEGLIHVVNFHGLQVPAHKNGNSSTEVHCKILAQHVAQHPGPLLLCGDFNLAPTSPSLAPLEASLTNQSTRAGLTSTRTHLTTKREVCDYIFTSPDVTVRNFAAADEVVSDHRALVIDFDARGWSGAAAVDPRCG